MAERNVPTVTRTVTVSDLTPEELASIFAGMSDDQQAAFWSALQREAQSWTGAPDWWGQAWHAVGKMDSDGRAALRGWADALRDQEGWD